LGKPDGRKKTSSWVIRVIIITFVISGSMSLLSESSMRSMSILGALLVLLLLVLIGILCDILGTAVTSADITPFLAMSAKRVRGAKQGVWLLKRADKVSNILNDVVGDICSIVSGAAGATIALALSSALSTDEMMISILISALSAAIMVGGKAWGKSFAIKKSEYVILAIGKAAAIFDFKKQKSQGRQASRKKTEGTSKK
jgi:CBS domain containing-hemolysin-like protein